MRLRVLERGNLTYKHFFEELNRFYTFRSIIELVKLNIDEESCIATTASGLSSINKENERAYNYHLFSKDKYMIINVKSSEANPNTDIIGIEIRNINDIVSKKFTLNDYEQHEWEYHKQCLEILFSDNFKIVLASEDCNQDYYNFAHKLLSQ
ncbi:hypothetical protein CN692_13450 [Bacillus sp. AFS002410]|uniref:hypothetical protein n=1 Tax=Bacillus sp. AFS002410 TaxID=2033481 RepID=UPI000BF18DC4|nr:hypothetical protein [Bacillus sp. AFS002410]PEJ57414.1 hypothetical protein CN692_13450 [Bacillus sp. AFS002410]